MNLISLREAARKLDVSPAIVGAFVFGDEDVTRYTSPLNAKAVCIDEAGFKRISDRVETYKRNHRVAPKSAA